VKELWRALRKSQQTCGVYSRVKSGGMSPIDLLAPPLIVERLQTEHLDSVLQIRSVQNDAGGASVVITVEDLKDRGTEAFTVEFDKIRGDLLRIQDRLRRGGDAARAPAPRRRR
jgi:hypothetical protein